MSSSRLLQRGIVFMSLSSLLSGVLWLHTLAAQPGPQQRPPPPDITVAPGTPPHDQGYIDYKNAKPMPMPSLPGPPEGTPPPTALSPGDRMKSPEPSPGNPGTGETSPPQVLIPPQPLPELQPSNDAGTTGRQQKSPRP